MNKFWVIVRQVVVKNFKTPTYILLLLTPIIAVLGIALFTFIANQTSQTPKIAIISNNDSFRSAVVNVNTHGNYKVNSNVKTKDVAEKQLANEKIDGYLTIDVAGESVNAVYKTRTNSNDLNKIDLRNSINSIKTGVVAKTLGLSDKQIKLLFTPANFTTKSVTYTDGKQRSQKNDQQSTNLALASAVTVLIYVFMLSYAGMIAQEIATEKGSKIMEILVSSVKPRVQFFAKVTAMFFLIIVQVIVTGITALVGINYFGQSIQLLSNFNLKGLQPSIILILALFFILGVLLYTTVAAGLGALVARSDQVGQAIAPLSMLALASYGASFVAMNSNSFLIKVGSFVPFVSQSIMPVRYAIGNATMMEAYISILLLAIAVGLALWGAVNLYERHVLDYSDRKLWRICFIKRKRI
ncbi:ABC transporter permease [Pediococcus claussenii]|uniref:ABC-2 transporter family protein n=1 Tax=Pediococcus claussenii (strain ATCC BAA-344 / DSM 14800 / JCM 18046 / KCTC 3811 / LMG 21948 / P06) TaxID=701521 RepID=G8PEA2_PEDCP|nr:ABC transporter permease [Pediococcus claussenii]AEV94363.1 ABC-2 transporter family protein [Pediococcus claussenii ATCC BAA-344]ANZ69585.1 ABC transporter [Pediococcus claussenii]ANZ71402.1 ABC transporter [Pediococcus claussenii]KRN19375.1 hypothetical protein IV79_GL001426 [Pediococcus claussenii]